MVSAALLALALASPLLRATAAYGCGAESDCLVVQDRRLIGTYRIWEPPAAPGARIGAIVFLHGWRGDAAQVMRDTEMLLLARRLGVALVAPQGLGGSWSFRGAPSEGRDEYAYFETLRQDLIARHRIDSERVMIAGFSIGASMAWDLACHDGERYIGFATISGAFWRPEPNSCPSPAVFLLHAHGEVDTVSPIEGRDVTEDSGPISVWRSFDILTAGASRSHDAAQVDQRGFLCTRWGRRTGRRNDAFYEFCRHGGGHRYEPSWFRRAWRMITGRAEG